MLHLVGFFELHLLLAHGRVLPVVVGILMRRCGNDILDGRNDAEAWPVAGALLDLHFFHLHRDCPTLVSERGCAGDQDEIAITRVRRHSLILIPGAQDDDHVVLLGVSESGFELGLQFRFRFGERKIEKATEVDYSHAPVGQVADGAGCSVKDIALIHISPKARSSVACALISFWKSAMVALGF